MAHRLNADAQRLWEAKTARGLALGNDETFAALGLVVKGEEALFAAVQDSGDMRLIHPVNALRNAVNVVITRLTGVEEG
jgi:hypothetical protein